MSKPSLPWQATRVGAECRILRNFVGTCQGADLVRLSGSVSKLLPKTHKTKRNPRPFPMPATRETAAGYKSLRTKPTQRRRPEPRTLPCPSPSMRGLFPPCSLAALCRTDDGVDVVWKPIRWLIFIMLEVRYQSALTNSCGMRICPRC